MRKLANILLFLFVLTAALTIVNELQRPLFDLQFVSSLGQISWLMCLATGTVVYIGLGFNRHLPKTILIPLFIWMAWRLLDYWPLENLAGDHYRLYAADAQLILGLIVLKLNKVRNHKSIVLISNQFRGTAFSGRRFLAFCLISLPIIPIALLLGSYSLVGQVIDDGTAGFVRLKPDGLYLTEKTYRQGEKQIRLTGMIHLGEENFYSGLIDSISGSRTLILAEGVSDEKGLLRQRFSYGKIADILGLESQEKISFPGRIIESFDEAEATQPETPDILRADIDLSQFDPRTLEVLDALAKYVLDSDSLVAGYAKFNRWAEEHVTNDINEIVMNDLVEKRNRSVLSYLPRALEKYDTVIIPWGALHMKGIEEQVKKREFQLEKSLSRRSIDIWKLPYRKLLKSIMGTTDEREGRHTAGGRWNPPPTPN